MGHPSLNVNPPAICDNLSPMNVKNMDTLTIIYGGQRGSIWS